MIRVGIGGWTFEPWRGTFFPRGLPHARELEYASRKLTSIEINGTFYRTQSRDSFRKWAAETPDDFVFSVKGHRNIVNRRKLGEAGESIEWFLNSGIAELGTKLGPLLWQFAPTKKFDEEDCAAFLALLPKALDGRPLMHALEVRHDSFRSEAFVALARRYDIAVVFADSDKYPVIADVTGPFVYARLQRTAEKEPAGYAAADLDAWAKRLRAWECGKEPDDLPRVGAAAAGAKQRPVFAYMISGAKVRAPAAAMALLERLK
jgi:uncharacterized protein YecE (DUF72 family)